MRIIGVIRTGRDRGTCHPARRFERTFLHQIPSREEMCPARSPSILSYQIMDRTFEDLRHEVLELDPDSQRKLADEIEEKLSESEWTDDWKAEIGRRLEKHRRGEGTYMTAEESLAKGRAMIEAAKSKQR